MEEVSRKGAKGNTREVVIFASLRLCVKIILSMACHSREDFRERMCHRFTQIKAKQEILMEEFIHHPARFLFLFICVNLRESVAKLF